jgi:hypothetical protein
MKCPHCQAEVKIFGKGWQSQRSSKEKHCPSCNESVGLTINGKKFLMFLLPALVFAVISSPVLGKWSLGVALAAILLPCAQLQAVAKPKR